MSNVTTAIEAMADPIGFDLAWASSDNQAALFNGLARGFTSMGRENSHGVGMQIAYLSQTLTVEALKFLEELGLAAQYERESRGARS